MAQYVLGIPTCFATEIRSVRTDTLFASMGLRVLNEHGSLHRDWPTQTASLGDHLPHSVIDVNMSYQNVDVPDPTPEFPDGGSIAWSFVLVNSGTGDVAALGNALNKLSSGIVGAVLVSGGLSITSIPIVAGLVAAQELVQILTASCDGVVGVLGLNLTAAQLAQMTSDPQNLVHQVICPGTDSPAGCGGNSNYTINYAIATKLATVPNVFGKSPEVARGLIEQAGLGVSVNASPSGFPGQPPRVQGQDPPAGSQVLPGTFVELLVVVPVPPGREVP